MDTPDTPTAATPTPAATPAGPASAPAPPPPPPKWPPDEYQDLDPKNAGKDSSRRVMRGVAAGILWFLLFTGGILIPTKESRDFFGWQDERTIPVDAVAALVERKQNGSTANGSTDNAAENEKKLKTNTVILQEYAESVHRQNEEAKRKMAEMQPDTPGPKFWATLGHFFRVMLFFTPLNIALLALLAGYLGGCASSSNDHKLVWKDLEHAWRGEDRAQERLLVRRLTYLQEKPVYSMIRSFVVYLILTAGIYTFSANPFGQESDKLLLTQYMRMAGFISLLGFIVGYDPTRFVDQWLPLIPSPSRGSQQADAASRNKPPSPASEVRSELDRTGSQSGTITTNVSGNPAPGSAADPPPAPKDPAK